MAQHVGKPSGKIIKTRSVKTGSKTKSDSNKTTKTSKDRVKSNPQNRTGAMPKGKSGQTMGKGSKSRK